MKLTSKILLVLVAVTMIVSCFTMFSSAQFTEANIEDILEYYTFAEYLSEDFESAEAGAQFDISKGATAHNVSFSDTRNKKQYKIAADTDGNKYFSIGGGTASPNFKLTLTDMYAAESFVTTFRYKIPTATTGASFVLNVDVNDPTNELVPKKSFAMLTIDDANKDDEINEKTFNYFCIDEKTGVVSTKAVPNLTVAADVWYSVELVCDFNTHEATLKITPDGATAVETTFSLDVYDKILGAAIKGEGVGKTAFLCLDDLYFYEGTFVRHHDNVEAKTSEAILNLEALSKSNIDTYDKIRIADVFNILLNEEGYTTIDSTPNKAEVDAAIEYAKPFINKMYVDAYAEYTTAIDTTKNYYERMDYVDFVKKFDDFLPSDATELEALDGVGADEVTSVAASDAKYQAEIADLVLVKADSEDFLEAMEPYDPTNRTYTYIKEAYDLACTYVKRDGAYKNPASEFNYATVADADAVFATLEAKKTLIETTAYGFYEAVLNMDEAEEEVAFGKYYANYCTAKALYNDGVLHPGLDNTTITTAHIKALPDSTIEDTVYTTLEELIESYKDHKEYVDWRVAESEKFMEYVSRAENSTYFVTIEQNLDLAFPYIDENLDELSVEDEYAGVVEARALYASLRQYLADSSAAAAKYLEEVAKIASATTFAAKKAAVESALNYKKTGNVTGLEGIPEANSVLAIAEAEIKSLEGYSATLIATVAKLKTATSMSERRELIKIALNCADKCEATISGVSEAKAELTTLVSAYDAEVKAINDAFAAALKNASTVNAAVAG